MNMTMTAEMNHLLLTAIAYASRSERAEAMAILTELGISYETAQYVGSLDPFLLREVAESFDGFFDVKMDERQLNMSISSCLSVVEQSAIFDEAICLGATREMMKKLCKMSFNDFQSRRRRLDLCENRGRPEALSKSERHRLEEAHNRLRDEFATDYLGLLIALARATHLTINRIDTYYVREQGLETLTATCVLAYRGDEAEKSTPVLTQQRQVAL